MLADGADCGSLLADVDVSAVAAFPHGDLVLLEDHTGLDVLQEVEVPLLVGLLDSTDASSLAVSANSLYMVVYS